MKEKVLNILQKYYGYKSFRKGQENIITSILQGEDVLAIMPTGGGKSLCYQIPALCLDGITIVISPLISLMKDQVDSLVTMGINSCYINSSLSSEDYNNILQGIINDEYKIIYVAPERLESAEFLNIIKSIGFVGVAVLLHYLIILKAPYIFSVAYLILLILIMKIIWNKVFDI